ncbi:MAG: AsmA family [Phycisphaerales bacterium]|nr:AsmA family [Phycisphaerales bacterium]
MRLTNSKTRRRLLAVGLGLLIAALVAPTVTRAFVRAKVREFVASQCDGDFQMGELSLSWPWAATVKDVSLTARDREGKTVEVFRFGELKLRLVRSPLSSGPVAIDDLQIRQPSVHLIRTKDGFIGFREQPASQPSNAGPFHFSESVSFNRLNLQGGRVVMEDRTDPAAVPMAWQNVNLSAGLASGPAHYTYHLTAAGEAAAAVDLDGSADLDALVVDITRGAAALRADPDARQSPLPTVLQQLLRPYACRGGMKLDFQAHLPMRDLQNAEAHARVESEMTGLRVPEWETEFDRVKVRMKLDRGTSSPPAMHFDVFEASAGDVSINLADSSATFDQKTGWSLDVAKGQVDTGSGRQKLSRAVREALANLKLVGGAEFSLKASGPADLRDFRRVQCELRLAPSGLSLQVPGVGDAFDHFTEAKFVLRDGVLSGQSLRALCADDLLFVRSVDWDLRDLPRRYTFRGVNGCVTPGKRHGGYPSAVSMCMNLYQPAGPFFVEGKLGVDTGGPAVRVDYDAQVHTPRGRFSLASGRIPIYNVRADCHVTPALVDLKSFDADALTGRMSATGKVDLAAAPKYAFDVKARGLDLKQFGRLYVEPGKPALPLSGRGRFDAAFSGVVPEKGPAINRLSAQGTFDLRDGELYRIPFIHGISMAANNDDSNVVSDAAAEFHIVGGKVFFDRAILSSPTLGCEGVGTIDFDGNIDFNKVIATVGGDWERNSRDEGAVGKVLGKVQGVVTQATRVAFYQMKVSGKLDSPKVTPIPLPFLAETFKFFDLLKKDGPGP